MSRLEWEPIEEGMLLAKTPWGAEFILKPAELNSYPFQLFATWGGSDATLTFGLTIEGLKEKAERQLTRYMLDHGLDWKGLKYRYKELP